MRKQIAAMALCAVLVLLSGIPTASATEEKTVVKESVMVTYLENGFYLVITLRTYVSPAVPAGAVAQVSGSQTTAIYSRSDEIQCSLTGEGAFSYDGRSAVAQYASYSYAVHNVFWSFSTGNAYYMDNTAYATATFKHLGIQPTTSSVSLSFSPDGVLS